MTSSYELRTQSTLMTDTSTQPNSDSKHDSCAKVITEQISTQTQQSPFATKTVITNEAVVQIQIQNSYRSQTQMFNYSNVTQLLITKLNQTDTLPQI